MSASLRLRFGGILIALFFLALAAGFATLHLVTPSDGARLEPGEVVWRSNGVVITVLDEQANGLRTGDVVVAVESIPLGSYAQDIFDLQRARPNWHLGERVKYTVLRGGQTLDLNIALGAYPIGAILAKNWSAMLLTLFTQIVATFVYVLRPTNRAARALYLIGWSFVHTYSWSLGLHVSDIVGGIGFWLYQLAASGAWLVFWSAGLEFALVFPREHPILQKRPWLVRVVYLAPFIAFALYFGVMWFFSVNRLDWLGQWIQADWLVAALYTVLAIAAIAANYVATRDVNARQKISWLVYAFFLFTIIGLVLWYLPALLLGQPLIDANALGLVLMPFPIILAIAILHNKLFDIDIIIRRTLIYSTLTVTLVSVYFISVVILQQLFRALTGAGGDLAIIISTLASAALFNPLRKRVQDVIDRRFYRRKYDAQKVLDEFARMARDETDLDKLAERLVDVVQETMEPENVTLWLKPTAPQDDYPTVVAAQRKARKK